MVMFSKILMDDEWITAMNRFVDDTYVLSIPGIDPDNLEVLFSRKCGKNVISVSGDCDRTIVVPECYDSENIKVEYKFGQLKFKFAEKEPQNSAILPIEYS